MKWRIELLQNYLRTCFFSKFLTSLLIFSFSIKALARAGGAGGDDGGSSGFSGGDSYSGSGSSSSDDFIGQLIGEIIVRLFIHYPIPTLIFILGAFFMYFWKPELFRFKSGYVQETTFKSKIFDKTSPSVQALALLQVERLSLSDIEQKARTAFLQIQQAWSEQNMNSARRYISDGVYQRFKTQIDMMQALQQKNVIGHIQIHDVSLQNFQIEGDFYVVDLKISASQYDQFISQKWPQLSTQGGVETFSEIWTFTRHKNVKGAGNMYSTEDCPQCGALITDKIQDTACCPYCSTFLNNCEFDWVLSEITQTLYKHNAQPEVIQQALAIHSSRQKLEDFASNAFLQALQSATFADLKRLQRFTTFDGAAVAKSLFPVGFLYNRIYIERIDLKKIELMNSSVGNADFAYHQAVFDLVYSRQRVKPNIQSLEMTDASLNQQRAQITLVKAVSDRIERGSVYANSCSSCGAAQKSIDHIVCAYCGSALNDPQTNWLLDNIKFL